MDSEDPLFVLYTSGSTGKTARNVLCVQCYVRQAQRHRAQHGWIRDERCTHLHSMHLRGSFQNVMCLALQHVFDYREGDIFGCVADIGVCFV